MTAPHSEHYRTDIDPITFAKANFSKEELLGFYRINAIKYVARFGKKDGHNMDDIDKAIFYLKQIREMEL